MDPIKLNAAFDIAFRLISSGLEIYNTLKKDGLTEQDLLDLIEKENQEQQIARQKLKDLLET